VLHWFAMVVLGVYWMVCTRGTLYVRTKGVNAGIKGHFFEKNPSFHDAAITREF